MEGSATEQIASRAATAADNAKTAADQATTAATEAKEEVANVNANLQTLLGEVTVGDPTTKFQKWEQYPAWALGALTLVFAFVMVITDYEQSGGWTFAAVALFVAVLLSYRTKFSLGKGEEPEEQDGGNGGNG